MILLLTSVAAVGCGENSNIATGPTGLTGVGSRNVDLPGDTNAAVKATIPSMVSPAPGEVVSRTVVIRATNAQPLYVSVQLSIEFELWEIANGVARPVATQVLLQDPSGATSWTPNVALTRGTEHRARARSWYDGAVGAWSAPVVFTSQSFLGLDEIDAYDVTYLHTNIADWPQTSVITGITMGPSQICVFHTGANRFPTSIFGEIEVEGNVWVFAPINGRWYGATWDWLRPGQQCKGENKYQLGPDQIRIPPMNTWIPESGSPICFAISARARDGVEAGRERSNIACTTTSP